MVFYSGFTRETETTVRIFNSGNVGQRTIYRCGVAKISVRGEGVVNPGRRQCLQCLGVPASLAGRR